jgi:uncharacterized phage protein (TIGR01671 family)
MREIKFRVFDNDKKEYLNCPIHSEYPIVREWEDISFKISHSDNVVLEQFTGLKDSKGQDIYEGDIVRMIKSEQYEECELQEVAFDHDRDFIGWSIEPQYAATGQVIGNIHENKDLIQGKSEV